MNLASLMKQAKQMQKKMNAATKEFEEKSFEFAGQQNLITGTMKGDLIIVIIVENEDVRKELEKGFDEL